MKLSLSQRLWAAPYSVKIMLLAAATLLLVMLGGRDLWTQEWRWANISWQMLHSGDYLHPYLVDHAYYDKPLLSYWLMLIVGKLSGGLSIWTLRLPSALAGITAVYCVYHLGKQLIDRTTGLVAGWMLLTIYYFIFWGRVANADMLNLAGILLSLVWYFNKRDVSSVKHYTVFFLILSITSLCKGLLGAVVPLLAILPDLLKDQRWKLHLRLSLIPAVLPSLLVYMAPFWASAHFGNQQYTENGLYEVYRENIVRYFQPFDHKGPLYTYFIFLPIYLLPWTCFFIPALIALPKRWPTLTWNARWFSWSLLILFVFFTLSGSRRNYYTLPLVPFATLLTAEWLAAAAHDALRFKWAGRLAITAFIAWLLNFCILQPLYYHGGTKLFARDLKTQASKILPWSAWKFIALDTPGKLTFYIDPAQPVQLLALPTPDANKPKVRENYTAADFVKNWPVILQPTPHTIFITRKIYVDKLKLYFKHYQILEEPAALGDRWLHVTDKSAVVAFIPNA